MRDSPQDSSETMIILTRILRLLDRIIDAAYEAEAERQKLRRIAEREAAR